MRKTRTPGIPGIVLLLAWSIQAHAAQPFDIDTYLAMQNLSELAVSRDGAYVAYTTSQYDLENDGSESAVWMLPAAGSEPVRLTAADSDSWSPKWSPDNRYLGILSSRKNGKTQVWLLDRRGGDARQLTEFKQGVRSFEWSPDGERMALLVMDPSPADLDEEPLPNPRPWVIERLQFKRDYVGYLDDRHTHVHVIDIDNRETRQLTSGNFDHNQVRWLPDGSHLVFVSNRTDWPDSNRNTDLWRIDVDAEDPQPEQLTDATYADSDPAVSPDGRRIAYRSAVSEGLPVYAIPQLAILDLESGETRLVDALAETQAWRFRFSADGRQVYAVVEYRGEQQLVRVDVESGAIERMISGRDTVREFDVSRDGGIFAIVARPQTPAEIYRLDGGELRGLGMVNRDLMADISTGSVEKHTYKAKDGTNLDTFVVFPPGYEEGKRYRGMLHIHGGPWAQWDWRFNAESQLFAARGFVVVMPNFRGSWGYGQAFSDALVGKWGDVDYHDSMDAMDFAIGQGWVDEDRMAVYGWSWGGFLTNHVITRTDRFRAAISGASETLVVANYGHDEWQRLWAEDPGLPWLEGTRETWDKVSPFYSLHKVTTPTLVVGGQDDWNMPILNSEQLYLVLRRRGIPTRLVVYPNQGHSLSVPSYERHLYEQYGDWLDRYVAR